MFRRKDSKPSAKSVARSDAAAVAAKEQTQRSSNLIETQKQQLELLRRLLAHHEQVGVDLHETIMGLQQHPSSRVRSAAEALTLLGIDRLCRLPRQLLDGDEGASAGFEHFIGKTRRDFEQPAEAATELLVYRLHTVMVALRSLAEGKNVDAETIEFQAGNDVDMLLSNEGTRQRISRERRR